MTRTGTIKLIHKDAVVAYTKYLGPGIRKQIIEQWKVIYGKNFNECAIQIRPDIYEHKMYKKKSLALNQAAI